MSERALRKLRILQVVPTYYPAVRYGGPIRSVHGLSAGLARRGHDVHVCTTSVDGDQDLDVPHGQSVPLDGVHVRYFPVPGLRRLFWAPSMHTHLRKTMASFDVVHLHSVFLWPTAIAASEARRARVPYLMSPRGMLARDVIRKKNRWIKTAWINLIEQRSLAGASGIHVTAELEATEVAALGLKLPKTYCSPNGLDIPASHQPLDAGPFADVPRPYVLFLSRISWKKGLDRLIKAWRQVPELHLLIAGNDDENHLSQLMAMPEYKEVSDRISFIGIVSDDQKWALYENAEMFVLPSYSENFGNVVVEAMAMRCPVVVTAEVGLAKFVSASGAGVVTSGDPEALAVALRSLHADSALRTQMGERGQQAVRDHLTWDAVAAEMEAVYRNLHDSRSS